MFLTCNDHVLHVPVAGPHGGPVLVLLHALGTEAALWDAQVRQFSATHRVICPEFRGHGSSAQSRTPLTCAALAEDVLSALDRLDVDRFTLAGCSLGGVVAQLVAARAKGRVTGLALFNSYVQSLDPAMWQARAARVRAQGLATIADAVLDIWLSPAERPTEAGQGLARILSRASDEGYAAGCDALAGADCRDAARAIAAPTCVAFGTQDKAVPLSASQALAAAIPGARLRAIEGAAHLPMLHHADACTAILKDVI